MMKKCHKCRISYDTEEFFCSNCGSILFEQETAEKEKPAEPEKPQTEQKTEQKTAFAEYIKNAASSEKFQNASLIFIVGAVVSALCSIYTFGQAAYSYWNMFTAEINGAAAYGGMSAVITAVFIAVSVFALLAAAFMLMPCLSVGIIRKRTVSYKLEGDFTDLTELFKIKLKKAIGIMNKYFIIAAVLYTIGAFMLGAELLLSIAISGTTGFSYLLAVTVMLNMVCVYYAVSAFSDFKNNIANDSCRDIKKLHNSMSLISVLYSVRTVNTVLVLIYSLLSAAGYGGVAAVIFGWYGTLYAQPILLSLFQTAAAVCSLIGIIGMTSCTGTLNSTLKIAEISAANGFGG